VPDPVHLARILLDVTQKAQPLFREILEKTGVDAAEMMKDPLDLRPAYTEFLRHLYSDPQKLMEMNLQYWQDWAALWQDSAQRFVSGEGDDIYKPEPSDKRFKNPAWDQNPVFDFIKQSYLLTGKWLQDIVKKTEGLDDDTRRKVEFYTRQFINAIAPTNFLLTNPEVLQETMDTGGENLLRGLENLMDDLRRGRGELKISTTDYEAFRLGENIATTPGKVIYQNELMQLIQYTPVTEEVFKRPLLIIPPWINKFYILDLRPKNSLIAWLVAQGHTVFTVSWVNPDRHLAQKRFEDYMLEGVIDAMDQVEKVTGEPDCNLISYCLGGTLTAVTLAWLAAHGKEKRVASATFLTTLVDFEQAGDMKLFMDESQLKLMDAEMGEKGFLPASHLKKTFSMLRANDMIWSFVINNYLMGKEPFPFDLLYWNDDSTNMPAAMHAFYMKNCYGRNLLPVPDAVTMQGTPIDMHKVKTPAFLLSTREDHIAPWKATYASTQLFSGPVHFVLAASGHVAGVINPPEAQKYCYWTSGGTDYPRDPEAWFADATQHDGSWWPHWQQWVKKYAGTLAPARKPGGGKLKPLEDAPGSYVKMVAED
jgi:polyhydroxyalkanoate synthase